MGGLELQFPQLEILDISGCNEVIDTGLVNLLQMSGNKLKHLNLAGSAIRGDSWGGLELQFPHLEILDISNCRKLTDMGLVNLLQMPRNKLVDLDLSHCIQLSTEGLKELHMIPEGQLKTLKCSGIPALSSFLKEHRTYPWM